MRQSVVRVIIQPWREGLGKPAGREPRWLRLSLVEGVGDIDRDFASGEGQG